MDSGEIRSYWDKKAADLRTDPAATMKDVILRSLEIEAVGSRLRRDDDVLDVGAGNAFAALQWAELCRTVVATDFSHGMLEMARAAHAASARRNVRVEEADVLDLATFAGQFSATTCVRCLINLRTEREQLAAVEQLARTLKPRGRLFLIEGIVERFEALNAAREGMELPAMPLNWHNRLLSQETLERKLESLFDVAERVDFGEYYFLSRIVHPLLVAPEEPRFEGRANLVARDVWRRGLVRGTFAHLSTLVLFVCERRG